MGINFKISLGTFVTAAIINLVLLCFPCFAGTVSLKWDANTEPSLAGYKVYYKADSATLPFNGAGATEGASPIDVRNQNSATVSGLNPAHTYYFAITAYDTSGVESAYSNIVTISESAPPSVSITSPANNSSVSGTVSVTANASDNAGVVKVELYVNGVLTASDSSAPYLFAWDTAPLSVGSYTLSAKAYDAAGNVGLSGNLSVTVVKDNVAPVVAIKMPVSNAALSGTVAVSATASDNIGVAKVEFYVDGALSAAINTIPYIYYWNANAAAGGSHILSARAYDAAGNVSSSNLVTVSISAGTTQQSTILGDLNGDGLVDLSDALLTLQIAAGNAQPTHDELQRGDIAPLINGASVPDGIIDIGDVIVVLSKLVSKPAT